MAERAAQSGIPVVELASDRLALDLPSDERRAYAQAKATLAVVVAPPSKRRLQPIAPSADWRLDFAEGCPAHCSYCYLSGSLKGPPIVRAYANLPEILDEVPQHLGRGDVTSRQAARQAEGTTFEASCYTDPLGIEHLTGSLAEAIRWFGDYDTAAQLRFTTKFDAVEPLLALPHRSRTRMRLSLNPPLFARHEGGASPVSARLAALQRMAGAGYPVGLTIAPIIIAPDWQEAYRTLLADVAVAMRGQSDPDLTVELITHRFTATSRDVLAGWYPGSDLDMDPAKRTEKRTKFGAIKHVYDRDTMKTVRRFFETEIAASLPTARILYFT